ncbi:MAG: CARDB domain-containing protein, partial [Candidatus Thermoplasmatota archaeon]|nr:CARDB domain-containing protein [Candidatus Thermoplasmatota archaeon]
CFVTPDLTVTLPLMEPYTTFQVVVIVTIAPDAALQDRFIGIKTLSMFGSSEVGGDHDETPIWDDSCTLDANKDSLPDNYPPNCDTNEQILELRLRAPDLQILEVTSDRTKGEIGEMLSVNVKVVNRGNAHATDVNIILCKDQSMTDIKRKGCDETNIVYRQIVKAIMPISEADTEEPNSITLLYMVLAGNHDIVVVVDPDNVIVETDESIESNMRKIPGGKMSSTLGVVDVGVDAIATYSVPVIILGATFSLVGVAGYVIYGRRIAAITRFAELSSLLPGVEDENLRF